MDQISNTSHKLPPMDDKTVSYHFAGYQYRIRLVSVIETGGAITGYRWQMIRIAVPVKDRGPLPIYSQVFSSESAAWSALPGRIIATADYLLWSQS